VRLKTRVEILETPELKMEGSGVGTKYLWRNRARGIYRSYWTPDITKDVLLEFIQASIIDEKRIKEKDTLISDMTIREHLLKLRLQELEKENNSLKTKKKGKK